MTPYTVTSQPPRTQSPDMGFKLGEDLTHQGALPWHAHTHSHPRLTRLRPRSPLSVRLPYVKLLFGGSRGSGPKGAGQEDRGGGGVCFVCLGPESGNEGEGAGRGGRSAGQELHGCKAALLGAGEAPEEVTVAVVLSCRQGVAACCC